MEAAAGQGSESVIEFVVQVHLQVGVLKNSQREGQTACPDQSDVAGKGESFHDTELGMHVPLDNLQQLPVERGSERISRS